VWLLNKGTVMTKQEAMLMPTRNLKYIMHESKKAFIDNGFLTKGQDLDVDDAQKFIRLLDAATVCKEELIRRGEYVESH
jgi:hypothetical protein